MRILATALLAAFALPAVAGEIHGKVEVSKSRRWHPGLRRQGGGQRSRRPTSRRCWTRSRWSSYRSWCRCWSVRTVEFKNCDRSPTTSSARMARATTSAHCLPVKRARRSFTGRRHLHPALQPASRDGRLRRRAAEPVLRHDEGGRYVRHQGRAGRRLPGSGARQADQEEGTKKDFPVTVAGATEMNLELLDRPAGSRSLTRRSWGLASLAAPAGPPLAATDRPFRATPSPPFHRLSRSTSITRSTRASTRSPARPATSTPILDGGRDPHGEKCMGCHRS